MPSRRRSDWPPWTGSPGCPAASRNGSGRWPGPPWTAAWTPRELRAQPYDEALAGLTELPGIGPFAAELVLLRGAGQVDRIPRHETRLARAVALAYRLPAPPSGADLDKLSENWRPYRTWVAVLLRDQLEDETGEIRGNTWPGIALYKGTKNHSL